MDPVAEATEEELNCYFFNVVLKNYTRRCHVGVFKRNTSFLQNNYRGLAKASCELVALVTLRVPPVLTVALLNFLFILAEDFSEVEVCSS